MVQGSLTPILRYAAVQSPPAISRRKMRECRKSELRLRAKQRFARGDGHPKVLKIGTGGTRLERIRDSSSVTDQPLHPSLDLSQTVHESPLADLRWHEDIPAKPLLRPGLENCAMDSAFPVRWSLARVVVGGK